MLKSYFKLITRNLIKEKLFSAINIFGLSIGMVGSLYIFLFVSYEKSYDNFHINAENLYRLKWDIYQNNNLEIQLPKTVPALAPALKMEYPEVKDFVRVFPIQGTLVLSYEQDAGNVVKFNESQIIYADGSFFNIFSFSMIEGNPEIALSQTNTIVLTKTAAKKYFGNENPLNKTMRLREGRISESLLVTGIIEDVPENSHLDFDYIISMKTLVTSNGEVVDTSWDLGLFYSYLLLSPDINLAEFEKRIANVIEKNKGESLRKINRKEIVHLQPVREIHLHSKLQQEIKESGDNQAVNFLSIIAVIILLMAWVNYINLSTAKSLERAKEVGIRKVVGVTRLQLIKQFIIESLFINTIAIIISIVLLKYSLPFLNMVTEKPITLSLSSDFLFLLLIVLAILIGSFFTALYPSFVLSAFKPIDTLRGNLKSSSKGIIHRNILVILQFSASIAIIAGTMTVYSQIRYMIEFDKGIDIDQVLVVRSPGIVDPGYPTKFRSFKTELLEYNEINNITKSDYIPGEAIIHSNFRRETANDSDDNTYGVAGVDADFIKTFKIHLLYGRNFLVENNGDTENVVINEAAAKLLGFSNPEDAIEENIIGNYFGKKKIIGVVKNFNQRSLINNFDPIIFYLTPPAPNYYSIKINTKDLGYTLETIENKWDKYFEGNPFDFFFLDDFFNKQYKSEDQFAKVSTLFAFLAILISCLGLFGLSSYTVRLRQKEISVRKVMGASMFDIMVLLSKTYLKLIFIAFLIGVPVIHFLLNEWLLSFAFRLKLNWIFFVIPGFIIFLIAFFTTSFQSMKAALINPTKTLGR